jgi:hypothetical protein
MAGAALAVVVVMKAAVGAVAVQVVLEELVVHRLLELLEAELPIRIQVQV